MSLTGITTVAVITVTITNDGNNNYAWQFALSYASDTPNFDPATGKIAITANGPAQITYRLDAASAASYNLIYANLHSSACATHQIRNLACTGDAITVTDANSDGLTEREPFCLLLIAREIGQIGNPIISPDPEVENNGGTKCP